MKPPFDGVVLCADGLCGYMMAIILDPTQKHITHLVVRELGFVETERLVPVELVEEGTAAHLHLRCTKEALTALPPFVSHGALDIERRLS
ncbi:hypothetical protein F8S13_27240 [Chloroflexia bacterium SDU3-3]|nr:hypothetical protein F8S13_27240 [Chloroflexia bacterium SDU3-3]